MAGPTPPVAPVQGQQGLVAAEEPQVGGVGQAGIEPISLAGSLGAGRGDGRLASIDPGKDGESGGIVHHRHHPVLQRPGLVAHIPEGVVVELLAAQGHRVVQGVAPAEGGVQVSHEPGGSVHVYPVAHGHHAGHSCLHRLLSHGAEGAHLGAGVPIRGFG